MSHCSVHGRADDGNHLLMQACRQPAKIALVLDIIAVLTQYRDISHKFPGQVALCTFSCSSFQLDLAELIKPFEAPGCPLDHHTYHKVRTMHASFV